LKENKKQTMDSIYTTKEYSDGTTLLEVKTVTLEDGKAMIDENLKLKLKQQSILMG
jgi:hypothetical protein